MGSVSSFIEHHYRHFNAATLVDAAKAYKTHIESGDYIDYVLSNEQHQTFIQSTKLY